MSGPGQASDRYRTLVEASSDVDTLVDRYGGEIRVEDDDPDGAVL